MLMIVSLVRRITSSFIGSIASVGSVISNDSVHFAGFVDSLHLVDMYTMDSVDLYMVDSVGMLVQ